MFPPANIFLPPLGRWADKTGQQGIKITKAIKFILVVLPLFLICCFSTPVSEFYDSDFRKEDSGTQSNRWTFPRWHSLCMADYNLNPGNLAQESTWSTVLTLSCKSQVTSCHRSTHKVSQKPQGKSNTFCLVELGSITENTQLSSQAGEICRCSLREKHHVTGSQQHSKGK